MGYTYYELINEWFRRSEKEKDYFTKFIFLFISFIAFISQRYEGIEFDSKKRDTLKLEKEASDFYTKKVNSDKKLKEMMTNLVDYLDKDPIKNRTRANEKWDGKLDDIYDWPNLVEFWFMIRNNLFHGHKGPGFVRDQKLVAYAFETLYPLMENFIKQQLVWEFD